MRKKKMRDISGSSHNMVEKGQTGLPESSGGG
jgi:hypothetical protein